MNMTETYRLRLDLCLRFLEVLSILEKHDCPSPVAVELTEVVWAEPHQNHPMVPIVSFEADGRVNFDMPDVYGAAITREHGTSLAEIEKAARWFVKQLRWQGYA